MNDTTRVTRERIPMPDIRQVLTDEVARLSASAAAKEAPRRAAGMTDVERGA